MGHREDSQLHYVSVLPVNRNGYPDLYQRNGSRRLSEQDRTKPVGNEKIREMNETNFRFGYCLVVC